MGCFCSNSGSLPKQTDHSSSAESSVSSQFSSSSSYDDNLQPTRVAQTAVDEEEELDSFGEILKLDAMHPDTINKANAFFEKHPELKDTAQKDAAITKHDYIFSFTFGNVKMLQLVKVILEKHGKTVHLLNHTDDWKSEWTTHAANGFTTPVLFYDSFRDGKAYSGAERVFLKAHKVKYIECVIQYRRLAAMPCESHNTTVKQLADEILAGGTDDLWENELNNVEQAVHLKNGLMKSDADFPEWDWNKFKKVEDPGEGYMGKFYARRAHENGLPDLPGPMDWEYLFRTEWARRSRIKARDLEKAFCKATGKKPIAELMEFEENPIFDPEKCGKDVDFGGDMEDYQPVDFGESPFSDNSI